ncbi:MAG: GTP 3',8-cyclase MoaA [Gammaproteobacteria bacterium]|nr:GTP 3',8-cyclase MoaA [Gammaproteobacteria bacterium]
MDYNHRETLGSGLYESNVLTDQYQRRFRYLRLSITDVCNFQCDYCLPNGYQKQTAEPELSQLEIQNIVKSFADLGTKKIRITGGEPVLRKDLPEIIELCKRTPGIENVALTTNGYRIQDHYPKWIEAGLDRLNVSIDSLSPDVFNAITGHDRLRQILNGLNDAYNGGLTDIKINTVLMKQFNANSIQAMIDWVKQTPFTLRFIELMQTGDNQEFFSNNHESGEPIVEKLVHQGWQLKDRGIAAGPAKEFSHPEYSGKVGLIMPYSKDFCSTCNRLRVSATGQLYLCLFGEQGIPLRPLTYNSDTTQLNNNLIEHLKLKKATHSLHEGKTGVTRHLSMIGG